MHELRDLLQSIKNAYKDGGEAAHAGKPLHGIPPYGITDLREAWQNGWTDAVAHMSVHESA